MLIRPPEWLPPVSNEVRLLFTKLSGTLLDVIHSVSQLRPGLVVSQAVRDPRGQILIPPGATLSEASIAQLVSRGVQSIDIDVEESPEAREVRIAAERIRIDQVLPESVESPELAQLRRILLEVLDA